GVTISRARKRPNSPEAERIIRISKDFGLLCSLTSFVAVEHRSEAERNEGCPALRRVPVKVPAGWGGVDDDVAFALRGGVRISACRISGPNVKLCEAAPQFSKRRMAAPAQS